MKDLLVAVTVVALGVFLAMPDKTVLVKVGWILVVYGASLTSAALMRKN